jgi:hypothetical protein
MGMRRQKPDLTPYTRVPYGPRRPTRLQLAIWTLFALMLLVPLAIFVYAVATTFSRGGDDARALVALFA